MPDAFYIKALLNLDVVKYAKIKGYVTHPILEQLKNLRTVLYKTVLQRFDCQF
ncbi:hypothetical protein CHCC20375_0661 [Bacillus licheniformis]|nr:hypothetical protein CHCC20375_0661 [Bacillus licheniformis]